MIESKFIKSIEIALSQINEEETEVYKIHGADHAAIISGVSQLKFKDYRIRFETSIVERIVFNLFKLNLNNVGWEINYPTNESLPRWKSLKLDFAFGYIANSQYLFENVVEVKFWDTTMPVPFEVWEDVFKIQGYQSLTFTNAGKNKYILVFFRSRGNIDQQIENIQKTFINMEHIKSQSQFFKNQSSYAQYFEQLLTSEKWQIQDIKTIVSKLNPKIESGNFTELIHTFKLYNDPVLTSAIILKV